MAIPGPQRPMDTLCCNLLRLRHNVHDMHRRISLPPVMQFFFCNNTAIPLRNLNGRLLFLQWTRLLRHQILQHHIECRSLWLRLRLQQGQSRQPNPRWLCANKMLSSGSLKGARERAKTSPNSSGQCVSRRSVGILGTTLGNSPAVTTDTRDL